MLAKATRTCTAYDAEPVALPNVTTEAELLGFAATQLGRETHLAPLTLTVHSDRLFKVALIIQVSPLDAPLFRRTATIDRLAPLFGLEAASWHGYWHHPGQGAYGSHSYEVRRAFPFTVDIFTPVNYVTETSATPDGPVAL